MCNNIKFIGLFRKLMSFALVVAMCSTLLQGVTVFADDNLFNLSSGAIRIESGTNPNTIKVMQGDVTKDNIPKETQITITGSYSSGTGDVIYVAPGVKADVKLSNANINIDYNDGNRHAFYIDSAEVTVELSGVNLLRSSSNNNAGLHVSGGASVTIFGNGSLTAGNSSYCGSGIGGDSGNITINSGTIIATGYWGAGIGVGSGNITINGGTITATGRYGAGIGGLDWAGLGTNVTINGGTIIASGGSYAAGIGSGYNNGTSKVGSITINGGKVTATGSYGAAIGGGGYDGLSCPIAINGGVVTANSIGGAGNYKSSTDNGAFTMNGNGIVFASSVSDNSPKTKGILFNANNGVMYGNVTVERDITISNNMMLAIYTGTLTIATGVTLTNNGTILLREGTSILSGGDTYGILAGSGQTRNMVTISEILGIAAPVPGEVPATTIMETSQYTGTVKWLPAHSVFKEGTSYTATITLNANPSFAFTGVPVNFFKVAGANAFNSAASGVVTAVFSATNVVNNVFDITGGAIRIEKGTNTGTIKVLCGGILVKDNILKETQITITGSISNSTGDGIYVAPGVIANIMLCNANINSYCAFNMSGAVVNLKLAWENTLRSNDSSSAGVRVPVGSSLTISGTGSLVTTGSYNGAGIGGNLSEACGAVAINGGVITAQGGSSSVGIGQSSYASNSGGAFTMNGNAIVFASSVSDNSPKTKGILFNGDNGVMYGDVTMENDLTISNNMTLTLYTGTLTIAAGVTLTNNGMILLREGTSVLYGGDTYGILAGSGQTRNMVTELEISGIAVPVPGEVPVTTVTETSQYTGTVKWLPAHSVFQEGTSYTATITLTAKPSFILTGVPANSFTVKGATTKNSVNSGVVTAVFSVTNAANNLFDISDGPIRIENGSSFNTVKVKYGKGLVKDYLSTNTQITITGSYLGDSNSTVDAIYVSQLANIKMNNVNINVYANGRNAFNIDGGSVNLELAGENTLLSHSSNSAGLRVPVGSSLTINGTGSLATTGYYGGAGIGGNSSEACGAVAIKGGVITAQGGSNTVGIGQGSYASNSGGAFTMNGNGVVFASSVTDNSPKTKGILFNGNNGVMYGNVTVERDITISNNMTLAMSTGTLTIATGATLTNNGTILLREGTSILSGGDTYGMLTGSGQIQSTVTESDILGIAAPVPGEVPATTVTETPQYTGTVKWLPAHSVFQKGTSYTATITLTPKPSYVFTGVPANSFTVKGATAVHSADSGVVTAVFSATNVANSIFDLSGGAIRIEKGTNSGTIKVLCGGILVKDNILKETQITITGSISNNTGDGVYVAPGVIANIMLCNATIISYCAFNMSGATVNLELAGENNLRSNDSNSAGFRVPAGASVTISGGGTLSARGSGWGAGIGGNNCESAGNITINGGAITAYSTSFGAGIGGGAYGGSGGNIIINNGIITTYGDHGAGIGGGLSGTTGNIIINGGTIKVSGSYGAGIGSGYPASSTNKDGSITINGGTITATGGSGASIGAGGYDGLSCPIAINGGVVTAKSIGGSGNYKSSTDNGAFTMNGNAVVFASFISDNSPKTNGILFISNIGTMYGNVTLMENAVIPSGSTLTIPKSSTLLIPEGITLVNNGTITPSNGCTITVLGMVSGQKINSANVTALTAYSITHNSVTLNPADLLAATGQGVEYAYNTSNNAPLSGWQDTPYFTELKPDTTYYFFARSKEDTNFRVGVTNNLLITTLCAAEITEVTTSEGSSKLTVKFSTLVSAKSVIAFYNDKKLLNMQTRTCTEGDKVIEGINIPSGTNKIKVMVWDGKNTLQPLCKVKIMVKNNSGDWVFAD